MRKPLLCLALMAGVASVAARLNAQEATDDPATQIVGKMQVAVGQLKKLDTGKPTQTTQKQIVENLDDLIARLEKECEACRGRKRAKPTKPLSDSVIRGGPGGMGDLHAARKDGKDWGELPPHERDRILQSMTEGFPAHYQRILERYYKRLAQETPVTSAAEPGPKNEPASTPDTDSAPTAPPAAGNER